MQISILEQGSDLIVIGMSGQYWETADLIKFETYIHKSIDKGIVTIKIDLSRVSFLSSQALGLFVSAFRELGKVEGKLILINPQGTVKEMIEIAGLDEIMDIEEN